MATKTTISLGMLIAAGLATLTACLLLRDHRGMAQDGLRINLEEAPSRLHPFIAESQQQPGLEQLALLQTVDRILLLRWYETLTDLSQRRALVWALGYLGGKEVVDRFLQALTTEFAGQKLSERQEDTLVDIPAALGLVAHSDDEAYAFLKRASDPAYWKTERRWRSPRGNYADNLLTSYSIQAVAISGRPDAMAFLEALRMRPRRYLHAFAGDVTQGVFCLYLRQKGGQRLLLQYLLSPAENRTLFDEWIGTSQGARWLEWANEQMRGPVPNE